MNAVMTGKKGIIFGVSNKRGIAYAIAKALYDHGAEVAFTYAGDIMEGRVRPIAEEMNSKVIESCDVTNEEEIKKHPFEPEVPQRVFYSDGSVGDW